MPLESRTDPMKAHLTQEGLSQGYCLFEALSGRLLGLNSGAAQRLNFDPHEAVNYEFCLLFPEEQAQQAYQNCLASIQSETTSNTAFHIATGGGDKPNLSICLRPIFGFGVLHSSPSEEVSRAASPAAEGYILATFCDGSAIDSSYSTDPLTGLPDRAALAQEFQRLRQETHAVLFADLNGFKAINDAHGHAAGDSVLQEIASRWQQTVRAGDLVVRYGGDEFVFLLPKISTLEATKPIVERLQRVTEHPIQLEYNSVQVSVAIGAAIANVKTISLADLIQEADRAMYASKRLPR
ncbi:MAG: GGDEF domain-containing protein [Lacipirellulaceae bacterium]